MKRWLFKFEWLARLYYRHKDHQLANYWELELFIDQMYRWKADLDKKIERYEKSLQENTKR